MELLNRVARSNRDLQRTVLALRLINQHLQRELNQLRVQVNTKLNPEDFSVYFNQSEKQPDNECQLPGKVSDVDHQSEHGQSAYAPYF